MSDFLKKMGLADQSLSPEDLEYYRQEYEQITQTCYSEESHQSIDPDQARSLIHLPKDKTLGIEKLFSEKIHFVASKDDTQYAGMGALIAGLLIRFAAKKIKGEGNITFFEGQLRLPNGDSLIFPFAYDAKEQRISPALQINNGSGKGWESVDLAQGQITNVQGKNIGSFDLEKNPDKSFNLSLRPQGGSETLPITLALIEYEKGDAKGFGIELADNQAVLQESEGLPKQAYRGRAQISLDQLSAHEPILLDSTGIRGKAGSRQSYRFDLPNGDIIVYTANFDHHAQGSTSEPVIRINPFHTQDPNLWINLSTTGSGNGKTTVRAKGEGYEFSFTVTPPRNSEGSIVEFSEIDFKSYPEANLAAFVPSIQSASLIPSEESMRQLSFGPARGVQLSFQGTFDRVFSIGEGNNTPLIINGDIDAQGRFTPRFNQEGRIKLSLTYDLEYPGDSTINLDLVKDNSEQGYHLEISRPGSRALELPLHRLGEMIAFGTDSNQLEDTLLEQAYDRRPINSRERSPKNWVPLNEDHPMFQELSRAFPETVLDWSDPELIQEPKNKSEGSLYQVKLISGENIILERYETEDSIQFRVLGSPEAHIEILEDKESSDIKGLLFSSQNGRSIHPLWLGKRGWESQANVDGTQVLFSGGSVGAQMRYETENQDLILSIPQKTPINENLRAAFLEENRNGDHRLEFSLNDGTRASIKLAQNADGEILESDLARLIFMEGFNAETLYDLGFAEGLEFEVEFFDRRGTPIPNRSATLKAEQILTESPRFAWIENEVRRAIHFEDHGETFSLGATLAEPLAERPEFSPDYEGEEVLLESPAPSEWFDTEALVSMEETQDPVRVQRENLFDFLERSESDLPKPVISADEAAQEALVTAFEDRPEHHHQRPQTLVPIENQEGRTEFHNLEFGPPISRTLDHSARPVTLVEYLPGLDNSKSSGSHKVQYSQIHILDGHGLNLRLIFEHRTDSDLGNHKIISLQVGENRIEDRGKVEILRVQDLEDLTIRQAWDLDHTTLLSRATGELEVPSRGSRESRRLSFSIQWTQSNGDGMERFTVSSIQVGDRHYHLENNLRVTPSQWTEAYIRENRDPQNFTMRVTAPRKIPRQEKTQVSLEGPALRKRYSGPRKPIIMLPENIEDPQSPDLGYEMTFRERMITGQVRSEEAEEATNEWSSSEIYNVTYSNNNPEAGFERIEIPVRRNLRHGTIEPIMMGRLNSWTGSVQVLIDGELYQLPMRRTKRGLQRNYEIELPQREAHSNPLRMFITHHNLNEHPRLSSIGYNDAWQHPLPVAEIFSTDPRPAIVQSFFEEEGLAPSAYRKGFHLINTTEFPHGMAELELQIPLDKRSSLLLPVRVIAEPNSEGTRQNFKVLPTGPAQVKQSKLVAGGNQTTTEDIDLSYFQDYRNWRPVLALHSREEGSEEFTAAFALSVDTQKRQVVVRHTSPGGSGITGLSRKDRKIVINSSDRSLSLLDLNDSSLKETVNELWQTFLKNTSPEKQYPRVHRYLSDAVSGDIYEFVFELREGHEEKAKLFLLGVGRTQFSQDSSQFRIEGKSVLRKGEQLYVQLENGHYIHLSRNPMNRLTVTTHSKTIAEAQLESGDRWAEFEKDRQIFEGGRPEKAQTLQEVTAYYNDPQNWSQARDIIAREAGILPELVIMDRQPPLGLRLQLEEETEKGVYNYSTMRMVDGQNQREAGFSVRIYTSDYLSRQSPNHPRAQLTYTQELGGEIIEEELRIKTFRVPEGGRLYITVMSEAFRGVTFAVVEGTSRAGGFYSSLVEITARNVREAYSHALGFEPTQWTTEQGDYRLPLASTTDLARHLETYPPPSTLGHLSHSERNAQQRAISSIYGEVFFNHLFGDTAHPPRSLGELSQMISARIMLDSDPDLDRSRFNFDTENPQEEKINLSQNPADFLRTASILLYMQKHPRPKLIRESEFSGSDEEYEFEVLYHEDRITDYNRGLSHYSATADHYQVIAEHIASRFKNNLGKDSTALRNFTAPNPQPEEMDIYDQIALLLEYSYLLFIENQSLSLKGDTVSVTKFRKTIHSPDMAARTTHMGLQLAHADPLPESSPQAFASPMQNLIELDTEQVGFNRSPSYASFIPSDQSALTQTDESLDPRIEAELIHEGSILLDGHLTGEHSQLHYRVFRSQNANDHFSHKVQIIERAFYFDKEQSILESLHQDPSQLIVVVWKEERNGSKIKTSAENLNRQELLRVLPHIKEELFAQPIAIPEREVQFSFTNNGGATLSHLPLLRPVERTRNIASLDVAKLNLTFENRRLLKASLLLGASIEEINLWDSLFGNSIPESNHDILSKIQSRLGPDATIRILQQALLGENLNSLDPIVLSKRILMVAAQQRDLDREQVLKMSQLSRVHYQTQANRNRRQEALQEKARLRDLARRDSENKRNGKL